MRLSKSDKNIGADGWRVDNIFEAADTGGVLAHVLVTNTQTHIHTHKQGAICRDGGGVIVLNVP